MKLNLEIEQKGLDITRRFDRGDKNYTQRIQILKTWNQWSHLERFFGVTKLEELLNQADEVFLQPAPLPWHLKILLSRLLSRSIKKSGVYTGVCRSTRGYNYYEMLSNQRDVILPPPKFEPSARRSKPVKFANLPTAEKRGIADTVLALAREISRHTEDAETTDFLKDFSINTIITDVRTVATNKWELKLKWDVHANQQYDRDLIVVPSQGNGQQRVLVASTTFREAFERIADLWHKPGFENFLMVAPPGSGKEVLARAVAAGLRLDYVGLALGTQPSEAIESKLFGSSTRPGILSKYRQEPVVSKASRGALLFFDEIDKCCCEARSALLRVLESKDYLDGSDGKIYELRKDIKFGFAGSKLWPEMHRLDPEDFWTRIQHTVKMDHPLTRPPAASGDDGYAELLTAYFILFWGNQCRKAADEPNISQFEIEVIKNIRDFSRAFELGAAFSKALSSRFTPMLSVRTLRAMVGDVYSKVYGSVLEGSKPVENILNDVKDGMERILHECWTHP